MQCKSAVLMAMVVVLVAASGVSARSGGLRPSTGWLAFLEGPATGTDAQCCHSAACAADHHCMAQTCQAGGNNASICDNYSCTHCECCPCCGSGEYCVALSSAPFTKGVCCPVGYKGADCKTPICDASCGHGKCSAPNKCTCDAGWSGATCETPTCDPACDASHGKCTGPNTCTCNDGWSGATCDTPVCSGGCHHGNCTAPSTCTCDPSWTGTDCNTPLCPEGCVHGVCQSPSNCVCGPGWEGPACDTCISDPYSWKAPSGSAFSIASVDLLGCTWKAGTNATVVVQGSTSKLITAGSVAWRLYESGATHFVGSGDRDYFQCTNKGCDPSQPVALKLDNPTTTPSNFTLTFNFTMPAMQQGASNAFSLYSYGEDQDHQPYDFVLTVEYNYTSQPGDGPSSFDDNRPYTTPLYSLLSTIMNGGRKSF